MGKYTTLLRKNLSRVVLATLALLIAVIWWFKQQEATFFPETVSTPAARPLDEFFPNPAYDRVEENYNPLPPEQQKWLGVIQHFDVFDAQIIRSKDDYEQRANQRFVEAQRAFDQGRLDLAKEIAEDIVFNIYPSHLDAKELLNKIAQKEKELKASESEQTGMPPGMPPAAAPETPPEPTAAPV